jgi:isoleucyl-tRNA synthetase
MVAIFLLFFGISMTTSAQDLLKKYSEIIKEEVNIKKIEEINDSMKISKIFKPIGSQLSSKFGKDTGKIIQYGKQGNLKDAGDGKVIVFDNDGNEWTLEANEYEIAYEGLEGDNMAVDQNIIAKLDLELTPELEREGIAREISRFLNQMRKEADYNVDDKVKALYSTHDEYLKNILNEFEKFFKNEALISEFTSAENPEGDVVALFTNNEANINFALKR